MSLSKNLISKKTTLAISGLITTLAFANVSYQSTYYSPQSDSSNQYISINITNENLLNSEIEEIKRLIYKNFNTKVIQTWIPVKNIEEKICIFVKCDIQNKIENDFEELCNFENQLNLALKDFFEDSNFFDSIGIL